jgi:hypothetical protein
MTAEPHEHRPGRAEQLAVLRINRAILEGADPETARQAAGDDACPQCVSVAAAAFGITLAQELAGAGFLNGPLRDRLLDAIDSAETEIRAAQN